MNVSPITYNNSLSMKSNRQSTPKLQKKPHVYTPLQVGAITTAGCFGVGFLFDRAFAYMFNLTRNVKTSLVLNGLVGLAMGAYTYTQANKIAKE